MQIYFYYLSLEKTQTALDKVYLNYQILGHKDCVELNDILDSVKYHSFVKVNTMIILVIWRRKWQPIPVLLPGKSHGWRSLLGYVHGVRKELDMTERLHFLSFSLIIIHLKADKVEAS